MIQPSRIARDFDRHEEVFLDRYPRLRAWALQLTENDRERAEDLVHDAYIQFTFAQPDLTSIHNLNGYLYSVLRNLHLSQVRRSQARQYRTLSIVDYDSAEIGLRAADPRERIALQDQLREVCRYACLRKQTSKAGSVLILRFLHGYYPREISQVMRVTREAVEERLRVARSEARQYLENPSSLRFLGNSSVTKIQAAGAASARPVDQFLNELRQLIFDSREGKCLTRAQLRSLYQAPVTSGIDHTTLAHTVSCPDCLDEVNRNLDLPLLAERFPTDTLGTDSRPRDGDGGDDDGGASGGKIGDELRTCRKAAKDVREHRPAELCVSVNGYLMAVQSVGSELSEQTVTINLAEKIEFVEIFSEQQLRLLFLNIAGTEQKQANIKLSDGRTLEATLKFDSPWPTLQVSYFDPSLAAESGLPQADVEPASVPRRVMPFENPEVIEKSPRMIQRFLEQVGRWSQSVRFMLRPGTITAVLSLLLIAALLFVRLSTPTVSASELLRRSVLAEEAINADLSTASHRTIIIEEQKSGESGMPVRQRVEIWQSASRGLRLRRLFDEQNHLVAGEWTKPDGASTVYRQGAKPQTRTAPEVAGRAILENGELWRLEASAASFELLIDRPEAITVDEGPDAYTLNYAATGSANGLLSASLTLTKADLRATEQRLIVWRDGTKREYQFRETAFERKPVADVPPDVFQPERELLSEATVWKDANPSGTDDSAKRESPRAAETIASPELEVEVTYLLNRIKANLGEQVSLTRTAAGALRVEALAENDQRKEEILRALAPVRNNPAVMVEVSTVSEALKRQPNRSAKITTREVEVANNRTPADAELRAYFSARLVGREAIDEEINRYANRVMAHSRQALFHASALKKLAARFSPVEIRNLAPDVQEKWLGMIHEHVAGYRREVSALRQELRPVFNGSGEAAGETVSEANAKQSADRLVELSYANDETVRTVFTVSPEPGDTSAIRSSRFWRSLSSAEKLAEGIDRVYLQQK